MRRAVLPALVVAIAGILVLGWLTLARVPADGLAAWDAGEGELRILEGGWAVLPRWRWERLRRGTRRANADVAAADDRRVVVRVEWNPEVGRYRIAPAAAPDAALAALLESRSPGSLIDVPAACASPDLAGGAACPDGWRTATTARVAEALGTRPRRLRLRFELPAATAREILLSEVPRRLPESYRKVFVLGLDGLDWDFVQPLVAAGRMPNLKRLMDRGAWGRMETITPILSPLIWTTIATGVGPDKHGVLDFVEEDPESRGMVPITGRSRRVPAIWNVASALGERTDVVGWWATWPAETLSGTMISDRFYYTLTQGGLAEATRDDPPDMISPADRTGEFVDVRARAVRETDWEVVREFMRVPQSAYREALNAGRGMEDPIDGFRRILASTRTYLGSGLRLAAGKPDLLMIYLEGTDTIGHLLARFLPPPTDPDVDPQVAAKYATAVPRYHELVDRWLGRYLERLPLEEYAWIVVSDHGFKWGEDRPRGLGGFTGATAPLWHDTDATFLLAGDGVDALGPVDGVRSVYEVAPTIAALLGVPAGAGWTGEVLPGVEPRDLEPLDYASLLPPSSYRPETEAAAPTDPEFIAELRALGYLGGGEDGEPEATGRGARPAREPKSAARTPGELNNLALIKIEEEQYDAAERLLHQAIEQSPDYASPHYNLRRIFMETGRYEDADRELWRAVDKGLRDAERSIDRAAADYDELGLTDGALGLLTEGIRRFPGYEPLRVHLLADRVRAGQCAEGVEEGARAAEAFPDSAPVHAFYGLAAACAGDPATARRVLERSLALDPNQPLVQRALSQLGS